MDDLLSQVERGLPWLLRVFCCSPSTVFQYFRTTTEDEDDHNFEKFESSNLPMSFSRAEQEKWNCSRFLLSLA